DLYLLSFPTRRSSDLSMPVFQNVGKYLGFQSLEGSRLTEESGNIDQNILEEGVHLGGVCLHILQIILHLVDLQNEHPSQDSSFRSEEHTSELHSRGHL